MESITPKYGQNHIKIYLKYSKILAGTSTKKSLKIDVLPEETTSFLWFK